MQVVGEAVDGVEAVELAGRLRPDMVLMDVRMPRLDGIQVTRRLAGHGRAAQAAGSPVRVLILTTFDHDEYVYEAMRVGASGFLLKTVRSRPADRRDPRHRRRRRAAGPRHHPPAYRAGSA